MLTFDVSFTAGDATTRLRFTPGTNKFTIGGTTHTRLYYFFKVLFATGDSQ